MKKLLLILGMTNFIAIETSLIISCSDKLTKPIERPKQAINPSQCGGNCNFEFSEILNSSFTPSTYNLVNGWLDVAFVKNQLPNDLGPVGNYRYWSIIKTVRDFYEKNFTSIEHNEHYIDKIINVKLTFTKNKDLTFSEYLITSFLAEMPPLPEKDNEQPKPRADHLKR